MATEEAGRRSRIAAAAGFAAIGGVFAAILFAEDRAAGVGAARDAFEIATVLLHALGGGVAGWLLAPLFGRRGVAGGLLALAAAVLATALGGLLGGTLASIVEAALGFGSTAQAAINALVGALAVPLGIAERPWLGALWLVLVALVRAAARP